MFIFAEFDGNKDVQDESSKFIFQFRSDSEERMTKTFGSESRRFVEYSHDDFTTMSTVNEEHDDTI